MLLITPRTFFLRGPGGRNVFLGRGGLISGTSGSTSVIGVGDRPWLQKVATLTVAMSLTIATIDTFRVAEMQYDAGYQDASALTDDVVGGLEIRVVRVISNTFLWLAQVQTLIRLFPRHKEKVIIKWTAFALIVLDTIFSILNSFVDKSGKTRPRTFQNAIPALSYLFELALSLLYAAWVIYYALEKRRFAFLHPKMRNISLIALLALVAVLIPVIFFVLDISKPDLAGWGDYMRWVGAAAASVVVWEWVERIEALERDERKDGILGREIFDGDEMLEVTPSSEVNWPGPHHVRRRPGQGGVSDPTTTTGRTDIDHIADRTTRARLPPHDSRTPGVASTNRSTGVELLMSGAVGLPVSSHNNHIALPSAVASPVSRTDTNSAASTVYAVHYHAISESTSPEPHVPTTPNGIFAEAETNSTTQRQFPDTDLIFTETGIAAGQGLVVPRTDKAGLTKIMPNPFKRRRSSPPLEVSHAAKQATEMSSPSGFNQTQTSRRPNNRSTLERFSLKRSKEQESSLPVVIIPAQPRGRIWSPDMVTGDGTGQPEAPGNYAVPSTVANITARNAISAREDVPNVQDVLSTSFSPSHLAQDLHSASSYTDIVLSQRGSLVISEEHPRRGIDHYGSPPTTTRIWPIRGDPGPMASYYSETRQNTILSDSHRAVVSKSSVQGKYAIDNGIEPEQPP